MSNSRVARRYSEAVMESASDQNQTDRLAEDFALLREMVAKSEAWAERAHVLPWPWKQPYGGSATPASGPAKASERLN